MVLRGVVAISVRLPYLHNRDVHPIDERGVSNVGRAAQDVWVEPDRRDEARDKLYPVGMPYDQLRERHPPLIGILRGRDDQLALGGEVREQRGQPRETSGTDP